MAERKLLLQGEIDEMSTEILPIGEKGASVDQRPLIEPINESADNKK